METKSDSLGEDYCFTEKIRSVGGVFLDTSLWRTSAVCVRGMGMMWDNKC